MTPDAEPRTEAGKRLDHAWPGSHIDRLDWRSLILAIEAEAATPADSLDALRCPDRCGGRVGHPGPHQSSDYVPPSQIIDRLRSKIIPGNEHGLTYQAGRNDGIRLAIEEVAAALRAEGSSKPPDGTVWNVRAQLHDGRWSAVATAHSPGRQGFGEGDTYVEAIDAAIAGSSKPEAEKPYVPTDFAPGGDGWPRDRDPLTGKDVTK